MSEIIELQINQRIDRASIDFAIANALTLNLNVVNNYNTSATPATILDITSWTTPELNALKLVLDKCTYPFENAATVFNIDYSSLNKGFNFAKSYLRDMESTTGVTAMPVGTELTMVVMKPGFSSASFINVSLKYDQAFESGDITALAAIGVVLSGDGANFTIASQTSDLKINFERPDGFTDPYVINYLNANTIIPEA